MEIAAAIVVAIVVAAGRFVRADKQSTTEVSVMVQMTKFSKLLAVFMAVFVTGLTAVAVCRMESRHGADSARVSVFEIPRIQGELSVLRPQVTAAFASGNLKLAEQLGLQCLKLNPHDPASLFNLACAEAQLGKAALAIDHLQQSIENGFTDVRHIANDDDLQSLHQHPKWKSLLELAAVPYSPPQLPIHPSSQIQDGVLTVDEGSSTWLPNAERFHVEVPQSKEKTISQPIAIGNDSVDLLLNEWQKEGTAVGLATVLYDNHDRHHSDMNWKRFPQLRRTEYSAAAKAEGLDNGLQHRFEFSCTTLGNSSTAMVGNAYWRSQPRLALSDGKATAQLLHQYFNNHIYVYPEHKDYDAGLNGKGGFGDVYPVNTPLVVISQGSSYSDKPFLDALAATLAAFRPEVLRQLESNRIVSPCLQMIMRRSLKHINSDEDYLSGAAHPVVFSDNGLDVERMVRMAHDMKAQDVPPIAVMAVVKESEGVVGKDYFEGVAREVLYSSAVSIARVFRSTDQVKSITVSVAGSVDVNRRKLTWHWAVLQGDPGKVDIHLDDPQGSVATISVKHHERRPVRRGSKMESSRVDIGVFANNGEYFSAPSIISFFCPENEKRVYDDQGRIQSVQYTDFANGGNYSDPLISTSKTWRDEYRYSSVGTKLGWTRHYADKQQSFTADGFLVTKADDLGRPVEARTVQYLSVPRANQPPLLTESPGGELIKYTYTSNDDFSGSAVRSPVQAADSN